MVSSALAKLRVRMLMACPTPIPSLPTPPTVPSSTSASTASPPGSRVASLAWSSTSSPVSATLPAMCLNGKWIKVMKGCVSLQHHSLSMSVLQQRLLQVPQRRGRDQEGQEEVSVSSRNLSPSLACYLILTSRSTTVFIKIYHYYNNSFSHPTFLLLSFYYCTSPDRPSPYYDLCEINSFPVLKPLVIDWFSKQKKMNFCAKVWWLANFLTM